jgi:hypothetical protein
MSVFSSRTAPGYRKQKDDGDARPVTELMHKSPSVAKHPLQRSWTLWFFKGDRSASWEANLCEIATVNTVSSSNIVVCNSGCSTSQYQSKNPSFPFLFYAN